MPYAVVHYFDQASADANQRTLHGSYRGRIGVQRVDATLNVPADFAPAPVGTRFCYIEVDENTRYVVIPAHLVESGGTTLKDGSSTTPGNTSMCLPAGISRLQGPIAIQAGDVIRVLI